MLVKAHVMGYAGPGGQAGVSVAAGRYCPASSGSNGAGGRGTDAGGFWGQGAGANASWAAVQATRHTALVESHARLEAQSRQLQSDKQAPGAVEFGFGCPCLLSALLWQGGPAAASDTAAAAAGRSAAPGSAGKREAGADAGQAWPVGWPARWIGACWRFGQRLGWLGALARAMEDVGARLAMLTRHVEVGLLAVGLPWHAESWLAGVVQELEAEKRRLARELEATVRRRRRGWGQHMQGGPRPVCDVVYVCNGVLVGLLDGAAAGAARAPSADAGRAGGKQHAVGVASPPGCFVWRERPPAGGAAIGPPL